MTDDAGFFGQFIEDYFAECDEHLSAARQVLLALERGVGRSVPDSAALRDLFRSLHTLKGLAGMVGDSSAESVAHAVEGTLRLAEQRQSALSAAFVDSLFASVDAIERCVAARRAGSTPPDVSAVLDDLERAMPAAAEVATGPLAEARTAAAPSTPVSTPAAPDASGVMHHFEFVPSAERTQRGVGVDAIRTRLRDLGTIIDAKPRMAGGGVIFDFRVVVPRGAAPDASWPEDGLSWTIAESAPPAPVDTASSSAGWAPVAGASVVRVELPRLDAVMRLVADLVISRSRLDDVLAQLGRDAPSAARDALEETNAAMERQLRQLRERVMRIRLVPVGEAFERLRFAARDAIRESGRRVALVFHGQSTEIDKLVVDRMLEPLLHLVRNAVSHGIELPDARVAGGKSAEGTLSLRAMASGDRIIIEVEDDGSGIDVERVAARGRERGLLAPDEALTDDRLLDVLCAPGFSTRDEADKTSGRGVGMDVVRSAVRALSGVLSVSTSPGRGTRFVVDLPLTLMIVDALLVQVSGQQMAVPQPALREILQVDASAIVRFENNDVVPYRGGVLPVIRLARLFGLTEIARPSVYLLVVGTESAPMALMVDRLVELREIVVHPVTDPLVTVPGVSGATELGDGRVSLILDAAAILRLAQEQQEHRTRSRHAPHGMSSSLRARRPSQRSS